MIGRFFYYTLWVVSFLGYCSSGISPRYGVFWAFLSWTIPVWAVLQASCFVFFVGKLFFASLPPARFTQIGATLSGLACLLFLPFGWATYRPWGNNTLPTDSAGKAFRVLSYNVHVFNSYPILQARNPHASTRMRAWVGKHTADIQCLQEFYHVTGSPEFDMIQQLATARGYDFHIGNAKALHTPTGYFGLVILSKFPIVRRGELPFPKRESDYQACIWADVVRGKDTIRIINVHLESFILSGSLDIEEVLPALATGFSERAKQVEMLTDFIAQTPYKNIVTGDFNDLPYSYSYQALKRQLYNAFETRGAGFGTTHASLGDLPRIRIDHIFYGKGLSCLAYCTHHAQTDSDHTPIEAVLE